MSRAKIRFEGIRQNTQVIDTTDPNANHMTSLVQFSMILEGKQYPPLVVEVRQPFGTKYASEPLEIGRPKGWVGPWNHAAFSDLCEKYYRETCGSSGSPLFGPGVRISGEMQNNVFIRKAYAEMDLPELDKNRAW